MKATIKLTGKKNTLTHFEDIPYCEDSKFMTEVYRILRRLNLQSRLRKGESLSISDTTHSYAPPPAANPFAAPAVLARAAACKLGTKDLEILYYLHLKNNIKETAALVFLSADTVKERLEKIYDNVLGIYNRRGEGKKYKKVIDVLLTGKMPPQ